MSDQQLPEKLRKLIIRKFKTPRVHSSFINTIQGVDLANMQLTSTNNKGTLLLLCVIEIVSRYSWFILLKGNKDITITNAFQEILDQSCRKPNKIWVDKGSKFYNRSMILWQQDNDNRNVFNV